MGFYGINIINAFIANAAQDGRQLKLDEVRRLVHKSCVARSTARTWALTKGESMSEQSEELKRIANALEEILRLVKKDQEETKKRWTEREED